MEQISPAFTAGAGKVRAPWLVAPQQALEWARYAMLLALAAMPVLHQMLGLNPIYPVFLLAILLDLLSRFRIAMLALIATMPIAFHLDLMGFVGWCLLLARFRWITDSPRRAAAMFSLWLGVYLASRSAMQAWAFSGIVGYCLFVLDALPPPRCIRTDFSMPVLLQLAAGILGLTILEISSTERFWFAVNPNIDSIFTGALLGILGCELLALFSAALIFRSRSGLLSVVIRYVRCLRFEPRAIHLIGVAILPFLFAALIDFLPQSGDVVEGPTRLLALHDASNAHRRGSLLSAISWLIENPSYLLGSDETAKGIYLFYNGIFPHNAFIYSALSDGLLVCLAFLGFTWCAFDRMRPAGRIMVLGIFAGVGFSDLGFDYMFVIATVSAGLLMDWRAIDPATNDRRPNGAG